MSEFRRHLIISSIGGGGGSWYRICEGGIYTTTNAYINTLFTKFQNRYLEAYVDCKVLELRKNGSARFFWGANQSGQAYNSIGFSDSNISNYAQDCYYGARNVNTSSLTNIFNQKPFLNKKVRCNVPLNRSRNKFNIQIYNGDILGQPIYANSDKYERDTITCNTPICLFLRPSSDFGTSQAGNNIVIYESKMKYNGYLVYSYVACQLTKNIPTELAWDNKEHQSGEYGMYDEVTGKFFGNANSTGSFIENID